MYNPIAIKRSQEYYSNYWEGYSPKMKRDVNFFGDLRYEYWLLVETNPNVISFCERPLSIEGVINGKRKKTQFDMWEKDIKGSEAFVKIFYTSQLDSPLRELEELWCRENGVKYLMRTEEHIRKNKIELTNKKQLLTSINSRKYPLDIDPKKILNVLSEEKTTIREVLENLKDGMSISQLKHALCWMIIQGVLSSNIDKTIFSLDTEVWINVKTKIH